MEYTTRMSKKSRSVRGSDERAGVGQDGRSLRPPGYGIGIVDDERFGGAVPPAAARRGFAGGLNGAPVPLRNGRELWSDSRQVYSPIQAKKKDDVGVSELQPENKTGLPDNLKAGIENLSGMAMDDVRVHYDSLKPAKLQALAYTQGPEIHVAPGQEKHLAHEVWHVVQQAQGRVRATGSVDGVPLNDDPRLEAEADSYALAIGLTEEGRNDLSPHLAIQRTSHGKGCACGSCGTGSTSTRDIQRAGWSGPEVAQFVDAKRRRAPPFESATRTDFLSAFKKHAGEMGKATDDVPQPLGPFPSPSPIQMNGDKEKKSQGYKTKTDAVKEKACTECRKAIMGPKATEAYKLAACFELGVESGDIEEHGISVLPDYCKG